MKNNSESESESKAILQPILDVFSGSDGGASFTKLRHTLLPSILEENSAASMEVVAKIKAFSNLCSYLLNGSKNNIDL